MRNQKSLMNWSESHLKSFGLIYLLILTTLILLEPFAYRTNFENDALIGTESYYTLRLSNNADYRLYSNDKMLLTGRPYQNSLSDSIMGKLFSLAGTPLIIKVLPILLGLLSIFMSYLILRKHNFSHTKTFLTMSILAFSPLFIYLFTTLNQYQLVISINLLGFYLFIQEKKYLLLSLILLSLTPLFGLIPALTLLALLFVYLITTKPERTKRTLLTLASLLFITLLVHAPFYNNQILEQTPHPLERNVVQELISDLGGLQAYSTFSLLLALIGFSYLWKANKKHKPAYVILLIIFFASLFYKGVPFYLNFLISILAGIAMITLMRRRWQLDLIKTFTILVLVYGILFSTVTYMVRLNVMEPDNEIIDSLEWLKENSEEGDIIFSHYTSGFLIQAVSDRKVLLDENFGYVNNLEEVFSDSETILLSRNLKKTTNLLDKYGVSYLVVTDKMKHDIWKNEEGGLMFLFNDKDTFEKIFFNNKVEIWRYLKK